MIISFSLGKSYDAFSFIHQTFLHLTSDSSFYMMYFNYILYVCSFILYQKKIEDVLIFNISLHYFLKKYLLTFPVRKSRKVVTVFSAIIRFWGWLLIFFAYLHSCTIFQLNFSFVLVGWYASRVWKWDQNWISFPAIVSMTIHGYCTTTVWPVKTNLHPLDT